VVCRTNGHSAGPDRVLTKPGIAARAGVAGANREEARQGLGFKSPKRRWMMHAPWWPPPPHQASSPDPPSHSTPPSLPSTPAREIISSDHCGQARVAFAPSHRSAWECGTVSLLRAITRRCGRVTAPNRCGLAEAQTTHAVLQYLTARLRTLRSTLWWSVSSTERRNPMRRLPPETVM